MPLPWLEPHAQIPRRVRQVLHLWLLVEVPFRLRPQHRLPLPRRHPNRRLPLRSWPHRHHLHQSRTLVGPPAILGAITSAAETTSTARRVTSAVTSVALRRSGSQPTATSSSALMACSAIREGVRGHAHTMVETGSLCTGLKTRSIRAPSCQFVLEPGHPRLHLLHRLHQVASAVVMDPLGALHDESGHRGGDEAEAGDAENH